MSRNKWIGLLFMLIIAAGSYQYYKYIQIHLKEQVLKSNETMMGINTIRFSFKVVSMLERGNSTLTHAIQHKSKAELYDALDYYEAAQAYILTKHLIDKELADIVSAKLETIYKTVESSGLRISKNKLDTIYKDSIIIKKEMEIYEKNIWTDIHKTYTNIHINGQELHAIYEYIIILISFILLFFTFMLIREKHYKNTALKHEYELKSLAYFDTLTQIPNRKSIENIILENIDHYDRTGQDFYIALIDLDNFKKINDTYGHESGDILLKECVKIIDKSIRSLDVLGRFGGDEFIVVFKNILDYTKLVKILERMHKRFKRPISIGSIEYFTNVSIGVSHYPNDAQNISDLIKNADIAMYNAKARGKGRYSFFERALASQIQRQYILEPDIKIGLEKHQFELYYQPQIDAKTGRVFSVEALARWTHPEDGFMPPYYFIDIIENGYMTKEFGEWAIKEAAIQQKKWSIKGIDLGVSVNLSVKHIMMPDFYDDMKRLVSILGINLNKFYFEITEYELLVDKERNMKILNELAEEGFKFHLDDYGTGYSSITYLNELSIESLKIDKSFIDKIRSEESNFPFVDAIVNMAKSLDIKIIAEGIETEFQHDYLKDIECDTLQGYYYSKAMNASDFEEYFLKKNF